MIGEAGDRLTQIEAAEGAAGNISVCVRWPLEPRSRFPLVEPIRLPQPVPDLAGAVLIVTGSGRRLREIIIEPEASLACVVVDGDGSTGRLYYSHRRRFQRVTSEFNSHLAVHADQIGANGANFLGIVHAQPLHLTYLTHIPRYQEEAYLNRRLLRWQPEAILNFPQGIGVLPFCVPGSTQLQNQTVEKLRSHKLILWARHGLMARSDVSVKRAVDLVEYAETAARYEALNLSNNEMADGLNPDEIREICSAFHVSQDIF